jgi:hypothetical protein
LWDDIKLKIGLPDLPDKTSKLSHGAILAREIAAVQDRNQDHCKDADLTGVESGVKKAEARHK